ncbi:putative UDP-3-O-acyl-N-acetylglucosamine deacetylase 5, mitochondrial [Glycine max]|nr:putative UDP-3-O-acyl-N-acetylglucosamine deacetylase 5, mitochondrial [Glycine max]
MAPHVNEPVYAWRNDSFVAAFPSEVVRITYGINFSQFPPFLSLWFPVNLRGCHPNRHCILGLGCYSPILTNSLTDLCRGCHPKLCSTTLVVFVPGSNSCPLLWRVLSDSASQKYDSPQIVPSSIFVIGSSRL